MNPEFAFSTKGATYWNSKSPYNYLYDKLYDALVPRMGEAETEGGELIRAVSRLGHEYYNNGNCNALEVEYDEVPYDCYDCDGSGENDWYDEDDDCSEEDKYCDSCGGSGEIYEEEECDRYVSDFYQDFLNYIRNNCNFMENEVEKLCRQIENVIVADGRCSFSQEEERPYVQITDIVVYYVWYVLDYKTKI